MKTTTSKNLIETNHTEESTRLAAIQRVPNPPEGDYPDFYVNGKPWRQSEYAEGIQSLLAQGGR